MGGDGLRRDGIRRRSAARRRGNAGSALCRTHGARLAALQASCTDVRRCRLCVVAVAHRAVPAVHMAPADAGRPVMGDRRATGTFEVTMEPQGAPDTAAGTSLGRMRLTKR